MRSIEVKVYKYEELSNKGKEEVKQSYLNADFRQELFNESIEEDLKQFKKSDLKYQYSLCSCQGDGFNIYGEANLYDFLEVWKAEENEKQTIKNYIDNSLQEFKLSENRSYTYSYKFIDKKNISDFITDFIEEYEYNVCPSEKIENDLIKQFILDLLDFFENMDKENENAGYKYFYEVSEEEIIDFCTCNGYEFFEDGTLV